MPAYPDADSLSNIGAVLNFHTPDASFTATRTENGYYDGPFTGLPEPGDYRLDNSPGGPGPGAFQTGFSIPNIAFE